MVSILHISDLHFTRDPEMHNMRQVLLDEARAKVHDKPKGEKLLIVTGDFHNFWVPDYQDALKFMDDLIKAMDIDPEKDVFLIPGNHDVANDALMANYVAGSIADWKMHRDAALNFLNSNNWNYLYLRMEMFVPYCQFARAIRVYPQVPDPIRDTTPAQVHIRRWRDKLNILHLNTALIADGKKKDDQLADVTTANAPETWEPWYRDDLPALAIGHNSFYDLEKKQRTELKTLFAQKNVSAYLCGDTHLVELDDEKQTIPIEAGAKANRKCIPNAVCAKSVADLSDSYSDFGYYWHEWDEETDEVTAVFRRWRSAYLAETAPEGLPVTYVMRRKAAPAKPTAPTGGPEPEASQPAGQDPDAALKAYLAAVLEQKRDSHPSFQLLKADEIDSRLFPKVEEYRELPPQAQVPGEEGGEARCPVWDIIRESWSAPEHRSVVIIGEGGIGKTVALFSVTRPPEGTPVPALYIPMYELVDRQGGLLELSEYIQTKYKRYGGGIEDLALRSWTDRPRLLVLLDGFNEVSYALRRPLLTEINAWHEAHPGVQLIAVSRPMDGLNLSRELAGDPISVTLARLDDAVVKAYLREAGRRVPAAGASVWKDLRYPLFLNLYIKTGRLKGRTAAGYPLRVLESDSGGALIWNYLQRELLRHSKDKSEKAEDWVLRCAVANEYVLPWLAYRMVSAQRMDISYDQVLEWTGEALDQLDSRPLPLHLRAVWEKYRRQHGGNYPRRELFSEQTWRDTVLQEAGILVSAARIHDERDEAPEDGTYVFMHQNFRDCLAGLHLVNQAEMEADNQFPELWGRGQSHMALGYAAELIRPETLNALWEANRQAQQYKIPGYQKNHTAICNLLELYKRNQALQKELNFSGMDLQGLSLARYLGKNEPAIPLFRNRNLSKKTCLNRTILESEGHFKSIDVLAALPDGRVVSGSEDHTLRIWDAVTGQCLQTLEGHSGRVSCIAVLPNGHVISGSDDHSLRVWEPDTGQCLHIMKMHCGSVSCLAVLPNGLVVSGSRDWTLRVWDTVTGRCLQTLKGHSGVILCISVLPDGRLVSGSEDSTLRVWDVATGQCLQTIGHSYPVLCVVNCLGKWVVSGSYDGILRIIDPDNGQCLHTMVGHTDAISCLIVLQDGRVVSGSHDYTLRVWDATTCHCLQTLKGHTGAVSCLTILPDEHIISGSKDYTLRMWDATASQCLQKLEGHRGCVNCIAVLSEGRIVSGSYDATLRVWDVTANLCLQTLAGHGSDIISVAVLPDGRVVSGSSENTLQIWDATEGQRMQTLEGYSGPVSCTAILSNGLVVSGSEDNALRMWDPVTGQCLQTMRGHTKAISDIAVLPDSRIVSGSYDTTLRVWDLSTGNCLQILEGHIGSVFCVAVLANGNVVSGSYDNALRVWDVESGKCLRILTGHRESVTCAAAFQGSRIVSGSYDGALWVWDAATGKRLQTMEGHRSLIYCMTSIADNHLISGSWDHTLRIWDVATGQCKKILKGHTDHVSCVAVLPDGRVVSGSNDGSLRVWDPDSGECLDVLEAAEVRGAGMDFSEAILPEDLARLLWHNGATISQADYDRWVKPYRKEKS